MSGKSLARMQNIANMAAARLAARMLVIEDAFMEYPDPLHDTFEAAYMRADSHGHAYGAVCNDAYCKKIRQAVVAALPQLAAAALARPGATPGAPAQ